jgi:hypothetical protein
MLKFSQNFLYLKNNKKVVKENTESSRIFFNFFFRIENFKITNGLFDKTCIEAPKVL